MHASVRVCARVRSTALRAPLVGAYTSETRGRLFWNSTCGTLTCRLVKMLACDKTDRILGVHILSTVAGEQLHEAALTQISALLINNLADMGGEDAVRVLSAHGMLVRELATWLDSAHDAATLQRLTGVFNRLSRSAVRSPPLYRVHNTWKDVGVSGTCKYGDGQQC